MSSLAELKARLARKPAPVVEALTPAPLSAAEVVALVTILNGIECARRGLMQGLAGNDAALIAKTTTILLRDHGDLLFKMGEAAVAACADEMAKAEV